MKLEDHLIVTWSTGGQHSATTVGMMRAMLKAAEQHKPLAQRKSDRQIEVEIAHHLAPVGEA